MDQLKEFIIKLKGIIKAENIYVDEPMKNHTSFKVGGPADILITPETYDEVITAIHLSNKCHIPYYVIGNGSNLLVKDGGIRGVVIKLSKLNEMKVIGEKIITQSGALLCDVSKEALKASLTGLEFACGIPGCVGGAITMNAGAYGGDISNTVSSAVVIDRDGNKLHLSKEQLDLSYRMSAIQKHGYIVLEVVFQLKKGDSNAINDMMMDLTRKREEKQPLEYPSAGSTFKRPAGYFTGKLIQDSGLMGVQIGGAEVSTKHAGFIINKGTAKAKDILALISYVQVKIKENYGVQLEPEVRIVGEEGLLESDADCFQKEA